MLNIKKLTNLIIFNLTVKKLRYLLGAFVILLLTAILSEVLIEYISRPELFLYILLFTTITLNLALIILLLRNNTPDTNLTDSSAIQIFFLVVPLVHLILGYFATSFYFPNLGPLIEIMSYAGTFMLIYIVFLVNNVFIVIKEKGTAIPLYAAAAAWVQIIIVIIAIPYFSGIFKIPVSAQTQALLVVLSSFLFNMYVVWSLLYDEDTRTTLFKEKIYLCLFLAFVTGVSGVGISFFPAESFLKGLFVASVQLSSIAYIYGNYKNRLSPRYLLDYFVITVIFLFLIFLFTP